MSLVVRRQEGEHLRIGSVHGRPVEILIAPDRTGNREISFGVQEMDPGGKIPLHNHPDAEELLYIYQGSARVTIEGKDYEVGPETAVFFPRGAWHEINVVGTETLKLTWTFSPPGYEHTFRAMARTGIDHEPPESGRGVG